MLAELMMRCLSVGASGFVIRIPNGRLQASRHIEVKLNQLKGGSGTVHTPLTKQYKRSLAPTLVQELEIYSLVSAAEGKRQFHKGDLNLRGLLPNEDVSSTSAVFESELDEGGLQISISLRRRGDVDVVAS